MREVVKELKIYIFKVDLEIKVTREREVGPKYKNFNDVIHGRPLTIRANENFGKPLFCHESAKELLSHCFFAVTESLS